MLTTDNIRRMQIYPFPINSQKLNYLKKMLNFILKAALFKQQIIHFYTDKNKLSCFLNLFTGYKIPIKINNKYTISATTMKIKTWYRIICSSELLNEIN